MARSQISGRLRDKIAVDAHYRCGYCLTPESFTAMLMHVDHIVPIAAGGGDDEANWWLACPSCNAAKATRTAGLDSLTGVVASLYNPRTESWAEHFVWVDDGQRIAGLTANGRVTVEVLRMNSERMVRARRRWIAAGWHPPPE